MSVELEFIDIKNAISFLQTVDAVDANKIAGLGICAIVSTPTTYLQAKQPLSSR